MKYLPLVWANLWRKRVRTILTMISVVVAFLLFGILDGVTSAFDLAVERYTDDIELRTQAVSAAAECRSRTSNASRVFQACGPSALWPSSAAIFRNGRTQSTARRSTRAGSRR